ncbi:uroporphyrinogen-III synthase [Bathymodiolus septemdierum thioautotrophic gill symbiont]|uniref:uroporphyrinogen-III synthase n=1 Tax=Bathymodiolus septemdierum thioautotrophic gill symbiont TaxID=113267 RepID=UPI0008709721|nr:uroporphyrinogen-III synthase [Bathymodiolus septemdierum thioautotrophic gill symbiont]
MHWTECVLLPNYWDTKSLNILLTRALSQVQPLQNLLSEQGYQPILFPSLEIKALANQPLKTEYDALIFISANAVDYGIDILKNFKNQAKIFAIGAATAKKIENYNIKVDGFPKQKASSEALLAMPMIKNLSEQSILIFRGEGGRETLKQGLEKNNSVEYIEVYRRAPCDIAPQHHNALSTFLQSDKGVVTATSVENLSAFTSMVAQIDLDALTLIKQYPLVVLSERIKFFAQSVGFNKISVASETRDEGLLAAIQSIL